MTAFPENDRDQRLATKGLSTLPDFIASPLHCFVRRFTRHDLKAVPYLLDPRAENSTEARIGSASAFSASAFASS